METTAIAKQMIGFQKTVFDNSFNAMVVVQDQTERMINNFMTQLPWVTEENRSQLEETIQYTKKARGEFKNAIDEGYGRFEELFDNK
ncbi:MAG TPA: hypothetical protein DHV36_16495 [Desulfobacteraceae bacterium]|nr:hypothetical protein [Desulfobacteraceae bacterium]